MPERAEGEARADVARRIDEVQRPARPSGYEIGSADDPDRVDDESDA
jgi:GTP-binding protein